MSAGRFRPDVEGLRGLAVLLVVAHHAWGWPTGGFVGVDVFFVISGYVITRGLLREYDDTGTVSLRAFLARRVRRLLPAAILVVVVTVIVARIVFFTPRFLQVLWDAGAAITSVQNWRLIRQGTDYFQEGGSSPLQHFWSLSVEEQFYVVWPIALLSVLGVAARRRRRAGDPPAGSRDGRSLLVGVVVSAIVLSFTAAVAESVLRPGWSYFSLESRVWELGVGALLAIAAPRFAVLRATFRRILLAGGLALVLLSAVLLDGSADFPGPWALPVVVGAAAVVAAGEHPRADPVARALTNPPMRALGRLSYSLYLWHVPVVVFTGVLLWWSPPIAAAIAVVVSVVLASATERFVERRWRRGRVLTGTTVSGRSNVLVGAGAALTIVLLVAVQVRGPAGLVDAPDLGRAEAEVDGLAGHDDLPVPAFVGEGALVAAIRDDLEAPSWPGGSSADALWPSTSAAQAMSARGCLVDAMDAAQGFEAMARDCAFGPPDADRTVVVLGDSVAISWLPAVVDALAPAGWRVIGLGVESCPAVAVDADERVGRAGFVDACRDARREAIAEVERLEPDRVVVSSALGSFERLVSGAVRDRAITEWRAGLVSTLHDLAGTGAQVTVLGSPPETVAVGQCGSRLTDPTACERSPSSAWFEKAIAESEAVDAVADPRVSLVAVDDWFCDESRCPAVIDRTIVTVDGGHLTETFARRLALVVAAALER